LDGILQLQALSASGAEERTKHKTLMTRGILWAILCAAGTAVGLAQTAIINFESESSGVKPNGYSAIGHPDVKFYDTVGAGLTIGKFTGKGLGNRTLAVWDDGDGSKLRIDFVKPMSALTLWFGNDDIFYASSSDRAWLEIWNGGTLVHRASMAMNLNKTMDQSISYSGTSFTQAFFWYGDSTGAPFTRSGFGFTGLIEMVDNISYTYAVIPEPGSALAVATLLGLGAFGLRQRRAKH
jgi:hypothetical protein